ncbi:MAG: thrombospondin type 3 repeat-containing protein [Bacteroidales bacterium]|nr:thrombospondin type 3 repeat-containing protein [Bacteroidales bacterium]
MKKIHLLLLILVFAVSTGAQTVNFPGGRIAFSSDGNQHDKDDWGATAMSLAILHYAGLSPIMVHYDHSDHIGNNNGNWEKEMIEAAFGGAKRFGFDTTRVFNDQKEMPAAIQNFKAEAMKSSASNPLWFICAGPMHVPYECLNAVPQEYLQYIYCISHSTWNEKHADAQNSHTWADMKADFPDVTFHDIIDQNSSNGDFDFNSPDAKWYWLRDSSNPDWKWLYERDDKNSYDVSDAGMTWWLITGGPNGGCDNCGWREVKELFENPISIDPYDSDLDSHPDSADNCPSVYNYDQTDTDGDGIGDVCDDNWDNDSHTNDNDNCPLVDNEDQSDVDGDGIGDVCDDLPYDFDNDGVPDSADNCVSTYNPDQLDFDNDSIGDVCDDDIDGDLVLNSVDVCPSVYDPAQTDSDKDGLGDSCDVYPNDPTNGVGPGVTIGKNYFIWEAEATDAPLDNWKLIEDGDANYVADASGDAHIEFTANGINGGNPNSPLTYTFYCTQSGTYQLALRARKRLEGAEPDKCNDGYVKLEGDYTSGNTVPVSTLSTLTKMYGGAAGGWGWAFQLDGHNADHIACMYNLKAGQHYTLTLAGRSIRFNVDYILLFNKDEIPFDLAKTMLYPGARPPITPGCYNIMAAEFDKFKDIPNFVDAYYDNGNSALAVNAADENKRDVYAAAQHIFEGDTGTYMLGLVSLLETDGESTYRVKVNSDYVSAVFVNDTTDEDYVEMLHELNDSITINTGDTIQVEFMAVTNGKIPEGNGTAYSRGRWSKVILYKAGCVYTGGTQPDQQEAFGDNIWTIPGKIQAIYFDAGGEGVAYHDANEGTEGGLTGSVNPRFDLVGAEDIEIETNNIGWIDRNEWVEYTISSADSGYYTINVEAACPSKNNGSSIQFELGGESLGSVSVNGSGGWQSYKTYTLTGVKISQKQTDAVLKLLFQNPTMESSLFNLRSIEFTEGSSSISETLAEKVSIYPNPSNGELYIDLSLIGNQSAVQFYNTNGQLVHSETLKANTVQQVNTRLTTGIYFVKIVTKDSMMIEKLIVE